MCPDSIQSDTANVIRLDALASHVQLLAESCDEFSARGLDVGFEPAQVFLAARRCGAQFVEYRVFEDEFGEHILAARRDEVDGAGLVPDDVLAPERLQDQD